MTDNTSSSKEPITFTDQQDQQEQDQEYKSLYYKNKELQIPIEIMKNMKKFLFSSSFQKAFQSNIDNLLQLHPHLTKCRSQYQYNTNESTNHKSLIDYITEAYNEDKSIVLNKFISYIDNDKFNKSFELMNENAYLNSIEDMLKRINSNIKSIISLNDSHNSHNSHNTSQNIDNQLNEYQSGDTTESENENDNENDEKVKEEDENPDEEANLNALNAQFTSIGSVNLCNSLNRIKIELNLHEKNEKNEKNDKNQPRIKQVLLTIKSRSLEERIFFQQQEIERYKNPHLPWIYYSLDGKTKSIVSPILKKPFSTGVHKPREHVLLKKYRPGYITILCLARDAASRLPNNTGTRSDICDLVKDSFYINDNITEQQLCTIISGALDRLHYEKDPCVKYDSQNKYWFYLHGQRSLTSTVWTEHLLSLPMNERNNLSKDYESVKKKVKNNLIIEDMINKGEIGNSNVKVNGNKIRLSFGDEYEKEKEKEKEYEYEVEDIDVGKNIFLKRKKRNEKIEV